ncbi:MAG: hypothetical protein IKV53_00460 [Clostridia bacterium]|nr:hypothetical protein [Clostridia bacterium]
MGRLLCPPSLRYPISIIGLKSSISIDRYTKKFSLHPSPTALEFSAQSRRATICATSRWCKSPT